VLFRSVFAAGATRPTASSLNIDTHGQTRAVTAIVALGTTRAIDVYTLFGGHLLVDLIGWYTGPTAAAGTDGLFVPNDPVRVLDTRSGRSLAPWATSTFEFKPTPPAGVAAGAVALNITATSNWDPGYVTAHPAGTPRPVISNLNLSHWPETTASQVLVPLSTRGVALYTSHGAHLIADLAGWFLGSPVAATQPVPVNPTRAPNKAVSVHVPKIGVNLFVRSGSNLDAIADAGHAATWSQLADVATPGNIMLFGHRTNANGPFRNLHLLVPGDGFVIAGADGHAYLYRVVDKRVTARQYGAVAAVAVGWGPATAQLVACSRLDGTPTSTTYVIVITGRLVAVS
jgi:sortase (surface protein transpeptidase)